MIAGAFSDAHRVLGARPGDADAAVEAHRRASAIAPCLVLNLIAAPGRSHRQRASRGSRPAIGSRMMRHISLEGVLARANEPRGASPERADEKTGRSGTRRESRGSRNARRLNRTDASTRHSTPPPHPPNNRHVTPHGAPHTLPS